MAALSPGGEEDNEEDDPLTLQVDQDLETIENLDLCLIGRFLTRRNIRTNIMKECMANSWRPGRGVLIKEVELGLFFFQFYHKIDKYRVISGGPWNFENQMLILCDIRPGDILNRIPLFHVDIWVQVHNLPVGFMSQGVDQQLGNYIGAFIEYDHSNNVGLWRKYMRIRVRLDVRIPLKREKKIKLVRGEWRVVSFRYERLGSFCFLCGLLGHKDSSCEKLFSTVHPNGKRGWGPELRAHQWRHGRGSNSGGTKWLRDDRVQRQHDGPIEHSMQINGINANSPNHYSGYFVSLQVHNSCQGNNGEKSIGGRNGNQPKVKVINANKEASVSVLNPTNAFSVIPSISVFKSTVNNGPIIKATVQEKQTVTPIYHGLIVKEIASTNNGLVVNTKGEGPAVDGPAINGGSSCHGSAHKFHIRVACLNYPVRCYWLNALLLFLFKYLVNLNKVEEIWMQYIELFLQVACNFDDLVLGVINIDTSFEQNIAISTGLILCYKSGRFFKDKSYWYSLRFLAYKGKTLGLLCAIHRAIELGLTMVVLELDSKYDMGSMENIQEDQNEYRVVISDYMSLLSSIFHNSVVEFYRKEARVMAHILIWVTTYNAAFQDCDHVTTCIATLIINEMT